MLEKPAINDDTLIHSLNEGYGKCIQSVSFLPLGADENTAVYKVQALDKTFYFLKLRRGASSEAAVAVPTFLYEKGMKQVIPALRTQSGQLHYKLNSTWLMTLHPFVEGHHGYEKKMTESQWEKYGAALKQLHVMKFPAQIIKDIPREDFSSQWHDELRKFLTCIEQEKFLDPVAKDQAVFLNTKKNEILKLIKKIEESVQILRKKNLEFILCHADIHCWNVLIDGRTGVLHIVDWDTLIFAPKERDLMFVGAGLEDSGYTSTQEAEMFFKGYGKTSIDPDAITYYRCVRIAEDLVIYCRQIFLSEEGGEDRKQTLEYVRSIFRPNGAIVRASE